MDVTEQLQKAHIQLSKTNFKFLQFVQNHPDTVIRSNYNEILSAGGQIGPNNIQPWPVFINQKLEQQFKEAGIGILNLMKHIPDRFFNNDLQKMSNYYQMPEAELRRQIEGANQVQLNHLLSRGDFVYSPSGLKCIEYNISSSLGGWQVAILTDMYLKIPVLSEFIKEHSIKIKNSVLFSALFEDILQAGIEQFQNYTFEINIAFVIPGVNENDNFEITTSLKKIFNSYYSDILKENYKGMKGEVVVCDFPQLEVQADRVFYNEKIIHVIIEQYLGEIPSEIFDVFRLGNVVILDGPISKFFSNKLNHALLSENEDNDILTYEERQIIKKYIPWTRRILPCETTYEGEKISMETLLRTQKDQLIIKAPNRLGGVGVYIGRFIESSLWEKLINLALQTGGIAQEYIETYSYLFQEGEAGCSEHIAVWGIFVFGELYGGTFLRILPKTISKGTVNSHQGAEKTVILTVEE